MTVQIFFFYLEMIGTIAFSASGTIIGIKKKMDVFGNLSLAVITATGGGMIRDMLLGITPPLVLQSQLAFMVAIFTSIIIMIFFSLKEKITFNRFMKLYSKLMLFSDAIGLGIFTVLGIELAIKSGHGNNVLLLLIVGLLTGVGGGVTRDVLAREIPLIFTQHIYAVASLFGGLLYILSSRIIANDGYSAIIGISAVFLSRIIAAKYKLNLPILK